MLFAPRRVGGRLGRAGRGPDTISEGPPSTRSSSGVMEPLRVRDSKERAVQEMSSHTLGSHQVRRATDAIVIITLTLAGLIGVLVSIMDLVGFDLGGIITKEPAAISLLLLSLISTAIGLERATTGRRANATLDAVEEFLLRSPTMRRIDGRSAIYKDGMRLVSEAQSRIRSFQIAAGVKAPPEFGRAVASRLRELDRQGKPARLDVVIVIDKSLLPPDFESTMRARYQIYEGLGVGHLVAVHLLDQAHPVGMDYLIIDRRHVTVSFTPTAGTHMLMTSIIFEDQPDIANQFAEWFDQKVLPAAERYI